MLPHAALRLKQGFGRLIRSSSDRGVVVLCDPRVVTKAYGRSLLATLPPARRVVGRWNDVRREVEAFYAGDAGGLHAPPTYDLEDGPPDYIYELPQDIYEGA